MSALEKIFLFINYFRFVLLLFATLQKDVYASVESLVVSTWCGTQCVFFKVSYYMFLYFVSHWDDIKIDKYKFN